MLLAMLYFSIQTVQLYCYKTTFVMFHTQMSKQEIIQSKSLFRPLESCYSAQMSFYHTLCLDVSCADLETLSVSAFQMMQDSLDLGSVLDNVSDNDCTMYSWVNSHHQPSHSYLSTTEPEIEHKHSIKLLTFLYQQIPILIRIIYQTITEKEFENVSELQRIH